MYAGEIRSFVGGLTCVPSLPPLGVATMEVACSSSNSHQALLKRIAIDPSACANLLSLANNGPAKGSVASLESAAQRLGAEAIRVMALSLPILDRFGPEPEGGFSTEKFWADSLTCAITAELAASHLGHTRPEEAYLAGLLHDLGSLILHLWNETLYDTVVEESVRTRQPLWAVEEQRLGISHPEVSRLLLRTWNFPEPLTESVWLHHQPLSGRLSNGPAGLAELIAWSDHFCCTQIRRATDFPEDGELAEMARLLGTSVSQLKGLRKEILNRTEDLPQFLNWDQVHLVDYLAALGRCNQELGRRQVKLMVKTQQLSLQSELLAAVCQLEEEFADHLDPAQALDKILDFLTPLIEYKEVLGVVPGHDHNSLQLCLRRAGEASVTRFSMPIRESNRTQGNQRSLKTALRRAVENSAESGEALHVREIISHKGVVSLPVESAGSTRALLFIDPISADPPGREQEELISQYLRLAALALEKNDLVRTLDQQLERLARASRQLEEARRNLAETQRLASVGRLAAGAAHEINNPLTTISAHVQLLARNARDKQQQKSLQTILDQSTRISKIIGDLMGLARPAPPDFEPTDINQVIESSLDTVKERLQEGGIEVSSQLARQTTSIEADPRQLEQVFINLFVNACQAMPDGGTLTVSSEWETSRVRVKIGDTGEGIAAAQFDFIFEPFFSTKRMGEGVGLGLAMTRSIVESHGGHIQVESAVGEGTIFTISLPANSKLPRQQREGEFTSRPATRMAARGRLLIIDDEDDLRQVLAQSLELEGYQVDQAADGNEGLARTDAGRYDAILLDLRMPGRSGTEILQELKRSHPMLPVIVISGLAREGEFDASVVRDAFSCLKKPFEVDELLNTVREAVDAHPTLAASTAVSQPG